MSPLVFVGAALFALGVTALLLGTALPLSFRTGPWGIAYAVVASCIGLIGGFLMAAGVS